MEEEGNTEKNREINFILLGELIVYNENESSRISDDHIRVISDSLFSDH